MLSIRLSRVGKTNYPFFRVVVMDRKKSAKGRALEVLGSVNPHKKEVILKGERILYWIGVGAQPSDTVHNLLVEKKVIEGKKIFKKLKSKPQEAAAETEAPAAEGAATPATPVAAEPVAEAKTEEQAA